MSKTVAELGKTYRAIVTGFEGVCVAKVTFLTGCDRAGLQSRELDSGKPIEVMYFDEPEIEEVPGQSRVSYNTEPVEAKTRRGGPGRYDPPRR